MGITPRNNILFVSGVEWCSFVTLLLEGIVIYLGVKEERKKRGEQILFEAGRGGSGDTKDSRWFRARNVTFLG